MRVVRWVALIGLVCAAGILAGCALLDPPPTANFTWNPSDPLARTDVQFNDSSTDSGFLGAGGIVSWLWDFGDGDSSPSQNPKHEYEKSGTYTVKLTVTDSSGGTHTAQRQITITPSLNGSWKGFIIDPVGFQDQFEIDFQHSAAGGITGTIYYFGVPYVASSISFNPASKVVRFQWIDFGVRFEGTLDPSETRITGDWYWLVGGVQGWGWDVSLQ